MEKYLEFVLALQTEIFSRLMILPQDVFHLSRHKNVLFPSRHQRSLPSPALSREEDCYGHSRGSPRHQPAGRQPGSPSNSARLPAPDRPDQLQGAFTRPSVIHTDNKTLFTQKCFIIIIDYSMVLSLQWCENNIIFFIRSN